MLRHEFIELLRCPETRSRLALAPQELIDKINQAVAGGGVKNRIGQTVSAPLDGGLLRQDTTVVYPILNEIPILLTDEGIDVSQWTAGSG